MVILSLREKQRQRGVFEENKMSEKNYEIIVLIRRGIYSPKSWEYRGPNRAYLSTSKI
jgi:hypothetical protein